MKMLLLDRNETYVMRLLLVSHLWHVGSATYHQNLYLHMARYGKSGYHMHWRDVRRVVEAIDGLDLSTEDELMRHYMEQVLDKLTTWYKEQPA
jgi:hypothetical protein